MTIVALQNSEQDGKATAEIKKKMRQQKFDDLKNKENFNHSIELLKKGYGEFIVKRCPPVNVAYTEFLPCGHCLNFYSRKNLHMDVKSAQKVQVVATLCLQEEFRVKHKYYYQFMMAFQKT